MQTDNQAKRMRLGTKSCTECRRRKVRCIVEPGDRRCRQCIAHKTLCRSQDAGPVPGNETEDLRARVASMEAMVRTVCQSIGQPGMSGSTRCLNDPSYALGIMSHGSSSHEAQGGESDIFINAPFVRFLHDNLNAQTRGPQSWPGQARFTLSSVQHLIPDGRSLRCVLQSTERFWSVWPLAPATTATGESCFPNNVPDAILFVDESLISESLGVVAKCLVWLCLCIQQLPKDFEETTARLPLRPSSLISCYLDIVDSMFINQSPPVCDVDCIEAMVLQYKIFVNMGRPQRAWKCTRNALDSALLLGIHRVDAPPRKKTLWAALWQHDRHLALFLGLPYTVPEQYIQSDDGMPLEHQFLHQLNVTCGHIVDRDQIQKSSFSSTALIVEEMERLEEMIPKHWATSNMADQSIPLGTSFWRQALILLFHFTNQQLHLPYAQAADKKYAYSRTIALQSAEATLEAHKGIRTFQGVPIICDFLDFCAFSAAMLLAIDLISENTRSPEETERLWGLVASFSGDMRHTATVLECSVAAQSAEVLGYIYDARHGHYDGPEDYEVTIPFFGKMHIKRPKVHDRACTETNRQVPEFGNVRSTVEVNSGIFSFRTPFDFQTSYELGEDWTTDIGSNTYDWSGMFEFC